MILDDAERFDALDRDAEVMRFLARHPPTLQEQRELIRRDLVDRLRHPSYGRYVAESPDGDFLGWFQLLPRQTPTVAELGYRLHRGFWGQGLATEGASVVVDHAFTRLGVTVVEAETMYVNHRSRRVMEKCGLTHVATFSVDFDDPLPGTDQGEVLYRLTRDEWVAQSMRRGRTAG